MSGIGHYSYLSGKLARLRSHQQARGMSKAALARLPQIRIEQDEPRPLPPPKPSPVPFRVPPRVKDILRACADAFDVGPGEMMDASRSRRLAYPRFAAMRIMRVALNLSQPQVGRIFERDHTTACNGFRRSTELRANDPNWRHRYTKALLALRRKWMAP